MQLPLPSAGLSRLLPTRRRLLRSAATALTALCTVTAAALFAYLQAVWTALPIVNAESLRARQTIRILDREGRDIYRVFDGEDRVSVQDSEISQHMKNAIIAIEDERFYGRPCVDPIALLRAVRANAADFKSQGASTITQQLVRNAFLEREKKISRKLSEIMLACRLEGEMEKQDILTLYLNRVPFGQSIHGVRQAALAYFGVLPSDLSVAQAAVLAALPQRPSYYTPYGTHVRTSVTMEFLARLRSGEATVADASDEDVQTGLIGIEVEAQSGTVLLGGRSDAVLSSMHRLGYIDDATQEKASRELRTMLFRPKGGGPFAAPHFSLLVRDKVTAMMEQRGEEDSWTKAGLRVSTTLDLDLQSAAERTVGELFPAISRKAKASNVALLALDRNTREVLAYIGSSDYSADSGAGRIDMVQAPRQPGSSFKPFVYAAAFARGLRATGTIDDTPLTIGSMTPKNYDGTFKGKMTVKTALAWSRNIPAIRAFLLAGGEANVLPLVTAAGVTSPARQKASRTTPESQFSFGWPMALGAAEVPLFELVQGYATLAGDGVFVPAKTIRRIEDEAGLPLYTPPASERIQAIPVQAARDVAGILADPANRPAGFWRAALDVPGQTEGAKTGTSNICFKRDRRGNCQSYGVNNTWIVGFTDRLVVGVWVGNADNSALAPKADGLTTAAPIWKEFLARAGKGW